MFDLITTAYAESGSTTTTGGGMSSILMIVVMLAIFYFLLIRPENKRKKQAEEMRSSLKKGDWLTTIGGVYGRVVSITDRTVVIETSEDRVRIEFLKSAIGQVGTLDEQAAAMQRGGKKAKKEEEAPAEVEAPKAEAPAEEEEKGFVKENLESIKHLRYSNAVNSVGMLRMANIICDKTNDAVQAFVLYKDMTIPGILERFYKKMQDRLGLMMTKADVTDIRDAGNHMVVSCKNTLLGMDFDLDVDLVVLPGGIPGTPNLAANKTVTDTCAAFAKAGKKVAAICAAPSVLAALGLLEGKNATAHAAFQDKLAGAHVLDTEVVVDGNITTSYGLGGAIPFALELVRQLAGQAEADRIQNAIAYRH